eukprot:4484608-Karenia_brevis.AAC.1
MVEKLAKLGITLTLLQCSVVRPSTQQSYLRALGLLLVWMNQHKLPLNMAAMEWDELLEDYILNLYERGKGKGLGSQTLAALRWAMPRLPRPLRMAFP